MQKDLSAVAEFAKRFATEAACRDYLIQLRWPEGFRCPHCGGRENWRLKNARFECRACGRQTSATAGTVFEGTRKPLRLWFRAMECVTSRRQGASARALQGLLRLPSYQTAWVWLHKLRRAMAREDPLHGAVEVGTAELWSSGEFGEDERGMIIIGAEVEGTRIGRVRMRPVRNGLSRYLHAFVEQCVALGSTIRTDDWRGYGGLAQKGYLHEPLPYWRNWDLDDHTHRTTISHPEPARLRPVWLAPVFDRAGPAVQKVVLIQQVPAPPHLSGLPFGGSDLAAL